MMMGLKGHRYPTRWNLQDRSKHQVLRSCKRKRKRNTLYIPREIIFNLLLCMPANVLHRLMRYVCKQWYDIINDPRFIRAHSQLSSAGHIIQNPAERHQVCCIQEDPDGLKVTQIQLSFSATLYGSLNGLVFLRDATNLETLYVMNLVTKVKLTLPTAVGLDSIVASVGFGVTSSGHYKVVYVPREGLVGGGVQLRVLTIGVDKAWRCIDVHGISLGSEGHVTLLGTPYPFAGFLYWFNTNFICFAFDIDTETIYRFSKPENFVLECTPVIFVSLGASPGLMKGGLDSWRLWKLGDVKSGSEWSELARIDVHGIVDKVDSMFVPDRYLCFIPVALIDREFWFYRRIRGGYVVVRYNLASDSFVFFPIQHIYGKTLLFPHVHTLLSPKKCCPGII